MQRYFFDTRDDDKVIVDDVGTCLPSLERAKEVATTALAELALDVLPASLKCCLGVDVRDADSKALLTVEMTFEARILA